ncbi:hypothetical protein [Mycolicibacterium sediminis]|uniref:Uncharacterized protein n=1 Tax=Mycolicibacterium sediminis TaxID=1286180 RepID=A0A7I7QZ47_9MYCO|nr:hypothetical protein [Mycolicibacterium sediminis]BBY31659.1 hypothetical protein MSEDJ_57550 [Mycolicibacterium sediminis]
MTTGQPPVPEPPLPAGNSTHGELGLDVEPEKSTFRKYLHTMSPRYVWSMADGHPVVIKQFLQFCLILVYPAFVFAVLAGGVVHVLFYVTVYPVLWLLFWPMRAHQKKNHPEDYAANRAKYEGKKWWQT